MKLTLNFPLLNATTAAWAHECPTSTKMTFLGALGSGGKSCLYIPAKNSLIIANNFSIDLTFFLAICEIQIMHKKSMRC